MIREEIEKMFAEFAQTLNANCDTEWYDTDRGIWDEFAERFILWRFREDIEREERRSMYLKLKKEFEGEV